MDPLPLSLLNDYLYCPRRAALKAIEGWWGENEHTVIGSLAHEHADLPGYEVARGVTLLRALPVWSERLGLSGKCDIVERHQNGSLVPVEYKKGRRRTFENDDAQLCAQALCLEEMFGAAVQNGGRFPMRKASAAGKWNLMMLCGANSEQGTNRFRGTNPPSLNDDAIPVVRQREAGAWKIPDLFIR